MTLNNILTSYYDHSKIKLENNDNIFSSLELFIGIQYNNGLVTELISFYEDMISKINSIIDQKNKFLQAFKIFKRNYANEYNKKFQDITFKYLGIKYNLIMNINAVNMSCDILSIFSKFINEDDSLKLIDLLSYGNVKRQSTQVSSDIIQKIILPLSSSFDLNLTKLLDSKLKDYLSINIYLGLPIIFIGELLYRNKSLNLTPEEITAITLHEIGHGLQLISSLIFGGYSGLNISIIKKNIVELYNQIKQDPEQLISAYETFKSLNLLNDEKDKDSSIIKVLDKKIDEIKLNMNNNRFIIQVIVLFIIIRSFLNILRKYVFIGMYEKQYSPQSRDIATSHQHWFIERFADEFVTKFNMSVPLFNGLFKLYGNGRKLSDDDKNKIKEFVSLEYNILTEQSYIYGMFNIILKLSKVENSFLGSLFYEPFEDRISRIRENTITLLKYQDIIDKSIIDDVLNQINYMDKLINSNFIIYKKKIRSIQKYVKQIIKDFINIISIYSFKSIDTIRYEYEKKFNQIDKLINNDLYISSYKLLSLSNKILNSK